jgi:hypothetical protein
VRRSLLAIGIAAALALGGAASLTRPVQNGATRVFSKIVDAVKDHPRATAAISLGGVAALWLAIGAMVVGQELTGRRGPRE